MPLFVITLAILCAAAMGTLNHPSRSQSEAAKIYASKCAGCHGTAGAGDGPAAVALDPKPTDFTSAEYQKSRTDEQIAIAIKDGKGTMPAFKGQFSDAQVAQLVAYLRSFASK